MYDVGVNWSHPKLLSKYEECMKEANEYGIVGTVGICNRPPEYFRIKSLSEKTERPLRYTCGYHPHNAHEFRFRYLERLIKADVNIAAIGECGLDYVREYSSIEDQIYAFKGQIELSNRYKKPIYCHERGAIDDVLYHLRKASEPVLMHCMTVEKDENWEYALDKITRYIECGYMLGISTYICKKERGHAMCQAIKEYGSDILEHIMVETDAPFMSPDKGPRLNTPAWTSEVVKKLVKLLGVTEEEVTRQVDRNTVQFFKF